MATTREDIWIRLRGASQFIRDSLGSAAAQGRLASETAKASVAMQRANHHGFAYNQTIFTMRRYLYAATLGLTAAAGAAAAFGFKFNVNMEKAQVSFKYLLGTQQQA